MHFWHTTTSCKMAAEKKKTLFEMGFNKKRFCKYDFFDQAYISLRKMVRKVSSILITFTSRNDCNLKSSNVSLKENKPDGVNSNSNDIDYYVRKKIYMVFGRLISIFVSSSQLANQNSFNLW